MKVVVVLRDNRQVVADSHPSHGCSPGVRRSWVAGDRSRHPAIWVDPGDSCSWTPGVLVEGSHLGVDEGDNHQGNLGGQEGLVLEVDNCCMILDSLHIHPDYYS